MLDEFKLAKVIKGSKVFTPEIAVVVGVDPLVIRLGDASYSADDWRIYEPWYEMEDLRLNEFVAGGSDSRGGSIDVDDVALSGDAVGWMKYHQGDLLAVQQMDGGDAFMILTKLRRVM